MGKYILVLNCGSSSVKFNLFQLVNGNRLDGILQGIVEEVCNPAKSCLKHEQDGEKKTEPIPIPSHHAALGSIFELLQRQCVDLAAIAAVGHRVVHGGDRYISSVRVDEQVLQTIRELFPLAPLHNPPNLTGLEECIRMLPDVPQVAVFDTAFHETMPESAYRYAIPDTWYRQYGVRKYGFHGTSHMYVARRAASLLGIPFSQFNGITAHLGNGCSITKVHGGRSVDTSMGFTPLEGVVMGSRSGDIDPALIQYVAGRLAADQALSREAAFDEVFRALNRESGLKALASTNMMQDVRAKALTGDAAAMAAVDIYAYRAARYIGQYWATLPWTDAIVFTAGVGENESFIRYKILGFLESLQIRVDEMQNALRRQETVIGYSAINPDHPLAVMVIPTDEESVIGYDALFLGYLNQPIPEVYPFELRNDN
jgi:acetate kinase